MVVAANVPIILTGGLTAYIISVFPDLIVGMGIAAMNVDAARACGGQHAASI